MGGIFDISHHPHAPLRPPNGWMDRLIHLPTASPLLSPSFHPPPEPAMAAVSPAAACSAVSSRVASLPSSSPTSKSISLRSLFISLPTQHLRLGRRRSLGRGGYDVTGGAAPRGASVVSMSLEAGIGVMGTKLGMMTYFEPEGAAVPVTVVGFREGNIVTQLKTTATDGYDAVQVGYRRVRDKKLTKPELGHLEKAGAIPMRHLQEFRLQSVDGFEPGQRLDLEEIFKEGDLVDVSGTSIGKGFQGTQPYNALVSFVGFVFPNPFCLSPSRRFYGLLDLLQLTGFLRHC